MESDIVSGQQSAWVLLKKLGEGDAGEVFLVESLLEKQPAILKRPARSPFASDVIRQTAQITSEGKILKALGSAVKMEGDLAISIPEVIDQSRPGSAYGERIFIVLEKASGFDLAFMARVAHMGLLNRTDAEAETPEEKHFLQSVAENRQVPERILLSALYSLLGLFEKIHARPFLVDGMEAHGILWNDVKPDHLYWDPWRARLTIIDWGNSQLLERDGTTRDRRYSAWHDYNQFIDQIGRFLENAAPDLHHRLEWPSVSGSSLQEVRDLHGRVWGELQQQLITLSEVRDREVQLLQRGLTSKSGRAASPLAKLEELHRQINTLGEIPDYQGALNLALSYAMRSAAASRLADVQQTCAWAAELPGSESDQLSLVNRLAQITLRADSLGASSAEHACLSQAIHAALRADWPEVLWSLVAALQNGQEPDWWYDLVSTVRRQEPGRKSTEVPPLLVARRALLTLQSMAQKMENSSSEVHPGSLERMRSLIFRLREETIPNWLNTDPHPPYSTLAYNDIDEELDEIGAFLPEMRQSLAHALEQPRERAQQVLDHWNQGSFALAGESLRHLLMSDPDRRRVLRAEHALANAPVWLEKVQRGPQPGDHYQDFIMDIEYEGRELRNQVGPADWLDLILEGCRQLRRGGWPPDLFQNLPLLIHEMPWLSRFERRERLPAAAREREGAAPAADLPFAAVVGTGRGRLGRGYDLHLTAPLDAWVAEARGSSARVFGGQLKDTQGRVIPAAIKVMRLDKVDYALPLFREEVVVLNAMRGVPGITPLLECGFLKLDDDGVLPTEREATVNPALSGALLRINPAATQEFLNQLEPRIAEGWTPYLAMQERDSRHNLLALCDAMVTGGVYRPVGDLLLMSIQICDIIQEAHNRNIVYRDHKILHYYWFEDTRGIYAIDWNIAKLHPQGLPEYEKQMDLVQFGARALHHILTGRPAAGALPLGPNRPDEIEQAAKSYQTQWTYDDQRLPEEVRKILERVLAGGYNNANTLRDDLKQAFLHLSEL